jgi:hypothetical protein
VRPEYRLSSYGPSLDLLREVCAGGRWEDGLEYLRTWEVAWDDPRLGHTMHTRLGKAFGNRLQEDSERLGVDAIDHLAPDEQLANRARRLRCVDLVDGLRQQLVTRCQRAASDVENPALVELAQEVVCRQQRLRVIVGRALESGAQGLARIARRRLKLETLRHSIYLVTMRSLLVPGTR